MKQQKEKNKKSLNSLINFIKYHNAFAIAVSLVVASMSLTFAASPEIRQDVAASLVSAKETVRSIDNTYVVGVDLANFDFGLQITDIKEDSEDYYISYAYKTIYIKDYVWQELLKEATLTIAKQGLGDRDLGLYVAEELAEVINFQLSYLKEVQQMEKQKGLSQKIVSIEYAGLIGRFLDAKEETFPGYEPVVSSAASQEQLTGEYNPVMPEASPIVSQTIRQTVEQPIDKEAIRKIVEELLAVTPIPSSEPTPSVEPTPEPSVNPEPSPSPSESPTLTPTESPAPEPSVTPEPSPEAMPSPSLTE